MNFVKSPSRVRSGVNTVGAESDVKSTARRVVATPNPPMWVAIVAGVSSALNLTAFVVILHDWTGVTDDVDQLSVHQFAAMVGSRELSSIAMALFGAGVVGLIFSTAWTLVKFPDMINARVWLLVFVSVMMYDFGFALFMRLCLGAVDDDGHLVSGKAKTSWILFLLLGGLSTGLGAASAVRVGVWSRPMFAPAAKLTVKAMLGLSICVYGIAPMVSVVSRNGQMGFIMSMISFSVIKLVILVTIVANAIQRNRERSEEERQALLVDHTTEA
jgi:hypothetical protein